MAPNPVHGFRARNFMHQMLHMAAAFSYPLITNTIIACLSCNYLPRLHTIKARPTSASWAALLCLGNYLDAPPPPQSIVAIAM